MTALHGPGAAWPETNCALDLWVELLARLGHEPAAMGGVALETDCFGDHWVMVKPSTEAMRELFGVEVVEFSGWKPTLEHVADHLAAGRLMTVETDSWWLPDTQGTAYRTEHVKTSIVPVALDAGARTLEYLHNAGTFTLGGDDFDGVLGGDPQLTRVPLPYLELVRQHDRPDPARVPELAREWLARHYDRRPADDPVARLEEALGSADWTTEEGADERFHRLAFSTVRQLGSSAQLAAAHLDWLGMPEAAARFDAAAREATGVQFKLARAARRRRAPEPGLLAAVGEHWASGMRRVGEALAR